MMPFRQQALLAGQEAGHRLRRYIRVVWASRGGGFYGFVATLMFLYLEALDLAGDVVGLPALVAADMGGVIGWAVGNAINAVMNLVKAALWPVEWIDRFGVDLQSILLFGAAYAAYRMVRPGVLRLLGDEPSTTPTAHPVTSQDSR